MSHVVPPPASVAVPVGEPSRNHETLAALRSVAPRSPIDVSAGLVADSDGFGMSVATRGAPE